MTVIKISDRRFYNASSPSVLVGELVFLDSGLKDYRNDEEIKTTGKTKR